MIKKKQISKYILLFFSTILSVTIFIIIYESISYIKYQNDSKTKIENRANIYNRKIYTINKAHNNELNKHRAYIECMETKGIMADCNNFNNSIVKPISQLKKIDIKVKKSIGYKPFKDLINSNIAIKFIYLLLISTLIQQIYLFLLSNFNYSLNIFDFHKSEWAINVAPMFGLLGTFFSMAILLNSNNENIDTALIKNFFNAVMTTMIGIIFYIINFYLKVYIYPKITEPKND